MKIRITGEARKVEIPKETLDGRTIKLTYTFVPTSHGHLVIFDKFAKKTTPEEITRALNEAIQAFKSKTSGKEVTWGKTWPGRESAFQLSDRAVASMVGKYATVVRKGGIFRNNPLREALVLEDLHHHGIRCEPPIAVLIGSTNKWDKRRKNYVVTIASPRLRPGHNPIYEEVIQRRAHTIGYTPLDIQSVGKTSVVIDAEGFHDKTKPYGHHKIEAPKRIEDRAAQLIEETRKVEPFRKRLKSRITKLLLR